MLLLGQSMKALFGFNSFIISAIFSASRMFKFDVSEFK